MDKFKKFFVVLCIVMAVASIGLVVWAAIEGSTTNIIVGCLCFLTFSLNAYSVSLRW